MATSVIMTQPKGLVAAEKVSSTTQALLLFVAFVLGEGFVVHAGITIGSLLAMMLLPVWLPVLRQFRGARMLLTVGMIAMVWGYVLSSQAAHQGYLIDSSSKLQNAAQLLGIVLAVGVLLWARTLVSYQLLGAAYGLGTIVHAGIGHIATDGNAWKFVWAIPVGTFVLSLASRSTRASVGVLALLALAIFSVIESCRSYSAALVLAALLLLWKIRPGAGGSRRTWWVINAGFVAALAWGIYNLGASLLVSGYLGAAAQERTISQLQASGSLILGGRPELAATWALMHYRPGGFGAGVVPGTSDINAAKAGMIQIGYNPDNGYVERFMFGGHIELHSVVGDMWAYYGIPGLVFIAMVVFLIVRFVSQGLSQRTGDALLFFLCVWVVWNAAFSPLTASIPVMVLAIAFILPPRADQQNAAGSLVGAS